MKKITVITGHYGSGKTNIAANLAVTAAGRGERVTVIDLDIVNPYFRTADFTELFGSYGVDLIKPMYANTNLDIPAISFDLERIAGEDGYLIIDVGGDDAGAVALGRYAEALSGYADKTEIIYVINSYRYLTRTPGEALSLMREIEAAARLRCTAIVNNSNLGCETDSAVVESSLPFARELSELSGLPVLFTAYPKSCGKDGDGIFPVDIYVKQPWQE